MYCHDPTCASFNIEQEIRYLDRSWEHPAEWVDEPECRACYRELEDLPLDVQDLVESAAERFNDDWLDWSPSDVAFFEAAQKYLSERTAA